MARKRNRFSSAFCGLLLVSLFAFVGRAQESNRKIVKKVEVPYPPELKSRGIGGTVRLNVVVKPDGKVKDINVLGGDAVLADAAVKSVHEWRFATASDESTVTVSVKFDPNQK